MVAQDERRRAAIPERRYHPDFEAIGILLETAEEPGEFFELAELAVGHLQSMRSRTAADPTPAEMQSTIDSLTLAWMALGRELGLSTEGLFLAVAASADAKALGA